MATVLAMGLLLMALVGHIVGAFNPGRLGLHGRTNGRGRTEIHNETRARYFAWWNVELSWWLLPVVFWGPLPTV